jgi:transcriptional regulator with XRE-family HTH domain
MNQLKLFGARLRSIRKAARITQEGIAEKAHLNPKYLGQIERGEKRPSFDAIVSLAGALDVSPHAFFQFDRDHSDERTLRKDIDGLLRRCTREQLRQIYRIVKALVEP